MSKPNTRRNHAGIFVDPCHWTEQDWQELHIATERVITKISERHRKRWAEIQARRAITPPNTAPAGDGP